MATNVFALGALRALEWRVYRAVASDGDALGARLRRLQQSEVLSVLQRGEGGERDEPAELWVFGVNGASAEGDDAGRGLSVWADGVWRAQEGAAMPDNVLRRFFAALRLLAARALLAKSEFVLDGERFAPNEARFLYRRPALARLDCLDVFLDEQHPGPSFELHFQVLPPSNLLTVTVDVVACDDLQPNLTAASWERLFNLPAEAEPAMVDVWHIDDSLAPRIVAETRHKDVVARFRSVTRKKHSRHGSESDGTNDQDNDKKGDENDENAEDDEDEAGHDGDSEAGDELSRRGHNAAKKKRKRAGVNEQAENDESVAPVSPDTHVNSPDASVPIVCMTFPHDSEAELRPARDVQLYRRKRNRTKDKTSNSPALAVTFGEQSVVTATSSVVNDSSKRPWVPQDLLGNQLTSNANRRPGSFPVKTESKPTLSVAVSLVESLSHNEQQEVLDSRPVKTHPLLQALQDYVENEASESLKQAIERQKFPKTKVVANAAAFFPSPAQGPLILSAVNNMTAQRLQLRLLSKEFDHWRCGYDSRRGFKKHRRYTSRSNQNRLLLGFSAAKLDEWSYQRALEYSKKDGMDVYITRDCEISIGVEIAASDAVMEWGRLGKDDNWAVGSGSNSSVAATLDKKVIAAQLQPYLEAMSSRIKDPDSPNSPTTPTRSKLQSLVKTEGSWMTLESYLQASTSSEPKEGDNDSSKDQIRLLQSDSLLPALCVATADSGYQIAPPTLSEYLLRNLHPVSSPKPADYVVVCPHSPSQWLGSLVLSYLTSFRSVYARSNMGDLVPVDISGLAGNDDVSIDAPNATLLLECAGTANDVFANFRSAGAMLRPLLSAGVKKQAFARSPVGNVVFLVAPFRRNDIQHKLWMLGAFASGLFDWKTLEDAMDTSLEANSWRGSVTIEILYLDDLFATELNPSPHAMMAECFSLFDRVGESVSLTPLASASNGIADTQARTRYIREKLYTVSDWREQADAKSSPFVHGGYTISSDGKWLVFACIDSVGSVCESRAVSLIGVELSSALARMMTSMVEFVTLLGEQAVLVVTRLNVDGDSRMDDSELFAWDELRASHWDSILPMDGEAAALATRVSLTVLSVTPRHELQPRDNEASALVVGAHHGLMVHSPHADSSTSRVSACVNMFGNSSTSWSAELANRAPVVLQLTHLRDLSTDSEDAAPIEPILRDFQALSFLTTNPVTGARESPLPLHLAVIRSKVKQLNLLQAQLAARSLSS